MIVTVYAPRVVELKEQVAVTVRFDERIIGEVGQETNRLFGEAVPLRLTFPLKLLRPERVTEMLTPV